MVPKYTKETFVEKAKEKHGDKYDYSEVEYKKSYEKVKIICPEHGPFWQSPSEHMRGKGCPECSKRTRGNNSRFTLQQFIDKSKDVHGDKYDYSKSEYKNAMTKICVTCPEHGDFYVYPISHYRGVGCPKCDRRELNTEDIIKLFKEVHGDRYDYSKVEYTMMHSKVLIGCPEHGFFEQTPSKHLLGQGCPKCAILLRADMHRLSKDEFIERARKCHGNKYDYSEVEFKDVYQKVKIGCPEHGWFYQRVWDHINGHGCSKCNESILESEVRTMLEKTDIKFIPQCNYETLGWLGKQSLDFYLPELKVAIECQGGQHYHPIEHFGGEGEFEVIKERDARKKGLCDENGVTVLYYSKEGECDIQTTEKLMEEIKKFST